MVELMRAGRALNALAREFQVTTESLRNWRRQADIDDGIRSDGTKSEDKGELARLRREVQVLREERDILKKAAAWFAQEAAPTPRGRSGS
jgi:transposase-like protein